jgi:hypothetical protein
MVDRPLVFKDRNTAPPVVMLWSLGTRLALFQHHRDPMVWEQLFDASRTWALSAAKTGTTVMPSGKSTITLNSILMRWRSADGGLAGKFLQSYGFVGI